jgi:hypothetical protein
MSTTRKRREDNLRPLTVKCFAVLLSFFRRAIIGMLLHVATFNDFERGEENDDRSLGRKTEVH